MILTFSAVCKPQTIPPPISGLESRIVGKMIDGAPVFEPKEDPKIPYFIVTQKYVAEHFSIKANLALSLIEIRRLQRLLEKK